MKSVFSHRTLIIGIVGLCAGAAVAEQIPPRGVRSH